MDERQFYIERQETKNLTLVCPHCKQESSYPVRWMVRSKKKELPRGAGEEDRKQFANARSYMVRVDELGGLQESALPETFRVDRSKRGAGFRLRRPAPWGFRPGNVRQPLNGLK